MATPKNSAEINDTHTEKQNTKEDKDTEKELNAVKLESVVVAVEKQLEEAADDEENETANNTDTLPQGSEKGEINQNRSQKKSLDIKIPSETSQGKSQEKSGKLFSKVKPPPTFNAFLGYMIVFGLIMFYFYLTDYRKVIHESFFIIYLFPIGSWQKNLF